MATETAAEKAAREAAEADEAAKQQKLDAAKATEEAAKSPKSSGTGTEGDTTSSDSGSEDETADMGSMIEAALLEDSPAPVIQWTYDQNRLKVGSTTSLLGTWVQGEEVYIEDLLPALGTTEQEQRMHMRRLLQLGALERMADQEPVGGFPTGPLTHLNRNPSDFGPRVNMEPDRTMILGQANPASQGRIPGQPTATELSRMTNQGRPTRRG